jgi:hypothetical protein
VGVSLRLLPHFVFLIFEKERCFFLAHSSNGAKLTKNYLSESGSENANVNYKAKRNWERSLILDFWSSKRKTKFGDKWTIGGKFKNNFG